MMNLMIDYDIIEDAKIKYMSPIEIIHGQEVYKILMRIADEVVD